LRTAVWLGVNVRKNTDVNDDAVSSVDPEPSNQLVGKVFIAIVAKQTLDWVVIGCFSLFWFRVTTVVDWWFVANRGRGKGLGSKVSHSAHLGSPCGERQRDRLFCTQVHVKRWTFGGTHHNVVGGPEGTHQRAWEAKHCGT
jgi:hypothetical protein